MPPFNRLSCVDTTPKYVYSTTRGGGAVEVVFGLVCKICVAFFAFNTGYSMWVNSSQYEFSNYGLILKRLLKFLISYWVILLLFVLYSFFENGKLPTANDVFLNMIALKTSYITFAWYVRFYIAVMLLSPVIVKMLKIENTIGCLCLLTFVVLLLRILVTKFNLFDFSLSDYMPCVLAGALVAKYKSFEFISNMKKSQNILILLLLLPAVFVMRVYVPKIIPIAFNHLDAILVPIFIYASITILKRVNCSVIEKSLLYVGTYSMNIWFIHAIFFTGDKSIQWIAYLPKYSVLVVLWTLVICLGCSVVCSYFQQAVNKIMFKYL